MDRSRSVVAATFSPIASRYVRTARSIQELGLGCRRAKLRPPFSNYLPSSTLQGRSPSQKKRRAVFEKREAREDSRAGLKVLQMARKARSDSYCTVKSNLVST